MNCTTHILATRLAIMFCIVAVAANLLASVAWAGTITYGDLDVLGTRTYLGDPRAGATLEGLAPNAVTFGAPELNHGYPFSPTAGDQLGTDQIYVGSVQTGFHDGYSQYSGRLHGPQILALDYSSLVGAGESVATLTLGIGADDFQRVPFGQPFEARINGTVNIALTNVLNSLDQTGPQVQFFSIGISPALLLPAGILTLSIDQGGDGGDGWAVDFLTVGVTTVPEPATIPLAVAAFLVIRFGRMAQKRASV